MYATWLGLNIVRTRSHSHSRHSAKMFLSFSAPQPSSYMPFEMTMCVDTSRDNADRWFYIRPDKGCPIRLEKAEIEDNPHVRAPVSDARDIVFVAQMPHMKNNEVLRYSPWFQSLLGVLTIQIQYMPPAEYPQWKMHPDPVLRLEVRMGYKTSHDSSDWQELSSATITRRLRCKEPHLVSGSVNFSRLVQI